MRVFSLPLFPFLYILFQRSMRYDASLRRSEFS